VIEAFEQLKEHKSFAGFEANGGFLLGSTMTKEELKAKVAKQQSIINDANNQICSDVKEYIESLPYKVGDKVSCSRCNVCWIASIIPERYCARYSGMIEVRINPAKKDGTRSNREFVLWSMEIDSIKKIS
jgi:hypothetical protein